LAHDRSGPNRDTEDERVEGEMAANTPGQQMRPVPMAIGMLIGAMTGFLIWITTDTFALFPAFVGMGLVLGLVLSRAGAAGP